jgi:hypothetical protein
MAVFACQYRLMKFARFIHRLSLFVALLGIIVGPMSIGTAGSAMASSAAASMEAMTGMGMSSDMHCCPDSQSTKPDCGKGCPLALVCTTAIVADVADEHSWSVAIPWLSHRFDMMLHAQLASTLIDPPVRPPKA